MSALGWVAVVEAVSLTCAVAIAIYAAKTGEEVDAVWAMLLPGLIPPLLLGIVIGGAFRLRKLRKLADREAEEKLLRGVL